MEDRSNFKTQIRRGVDINNKQSKSKSKTSSLKTKAMKINSYIVTVLSILGFILPWVFSHYTYEFYELTKNTIIIIAVVILLMLWAIKVSVAKKLVINRTPFDIPIALFLSSKILSTIFSIYKPTSIWGYYSRYTGGLISNITLILLYYIIINNITKKEDLVKILKTTIFSLVLMGVFIILKSFGAFEGIFQRLIDSHPSLVYLNSSIFSPVGSPNILTFLFIAALPILMSFISSSEEDFTMQVFGIIGSCICLLAIGITAISSIGFYGLMIWIIVILTILTIFIVNMPLTQNFTLKLLPVIIFAVFSIIFSFSSSFRGAITNKLSFARYQDISFNTSWSVIMGTFKEHKVEGFLVGTGLDTYAYNFTRFRPIEQNLEPNWNQNYTKGSRELLGLLSESGLFGLLSFLFVVFFVLSFIFKNIIKKDISGDHKALGMGIAIVAIFVSSILVSYTIVMLYLLWLLIAFTVVNYYLNNERDLERYEVSLNISKSKIAIENEKDIVPYILLSVSAILLIFAGFMSLRNYIAEYQYKRSLVSISWGELDKSYDYVNKSLKKNEKRDYYHRQLAYTALQRLNSTLGQTAEDEETQNRIQTSQNYYISLIEQEIERSIGLNSLDASNWEAAAVIYKQLVEITNGKLYGDETLLFASRAIEVNPYNPDNYIILGYIYQFNSNEELRNQAGQIFRQAYNLQPSYILSIFSLGNYLEYVEQYDDAISLYTNTINNYYSYESEVNTLLNERIELAEEKKEGAATDTGEVVPSDEDITEEVEENLIPGSEDNLGDDSDKVTYP